ncbi:MAG: SPASM domain-containing protein, partial [Myxococcota bacterium]
RISACGLPVYTGQRPPHSDAVWVRRTDHDHFMANQKARAALASVARTLETEADLGEESAPRCCTAPERSPTISWDGKVTICPWDPSLANVVGDVVSSTFSAAWSSEELETDRRAVRERGVPDRSLCRNCPMPWSPNQD